MVFKQIKSNFGHQLLLIFVGLISIAFLAIGYFSYSYMREALINEVQTRLDLVLRLKLEALEKQMASLILRKVPEELIADTIQGHIEKPLIEDGFIAIIRPPFSIVAASNNVSLDTFTPIFLSKNLMPEAVNTLKITFDNKTFLSRYVSFKEINWVLLAGEEEARLTDGLFRLRNKIIVIYFIILLFMIVASKFITWRIVEPIKILSIFAKTFSINKKNDLIKTGRIDEIGVLTTSFTWMTTNLEIAIEKERQLREAQIMLNTFLQLTTKNISLKEALGIVIEKVVLFDPKIFQPRGCILLTNSADKAASSQLKIVAAINFDDFILKNYTDLTLNNWVEDKITKGEIVFKSYSYAGQLHQEVESGNYLCVPILNESSKILGIMNVYVTEKCKEDDTVVKLLKSVSDVIAGLIQYKILEEEKEEIQLRLVEISRQAGMSEVATGVLHNVGNVLNSINISAGEIDDILKKSCGSKFAQIVPVIENKFGQLDNYFSTDKKGKLIPQILVQLKEEQGKEDLTLAREIKNLKNNVEHVKNIISVQQSMAGIKGLVEEISLRALIDQAIQVNSIALDRHSIKLTKKYQKEVIAKTDRLKVLQIIVNLLSNSKHALLGVDGGKIDIVLEKKDEWAYLEIIDNGIGIEKENMTNIFQFGHTTKRNGHGFGLHSSALSAKELGGELTAKSEGKNKGATFTLKIPINS